MKNSIYYDGSNYYSVAKHKDGSYIKWEVDKVGKYKQGGNIHKYNNMVDMNMDLNKMYQVGGEIKPLDSPSQIYAGDLYFKYGTNPNIQKNFDYGLRIHPNQVKPLIANDSTPSNEQDLTGYNQSIKPITTNSTKSEPTTNPWKFDPHKLNVYGNQISENALNRTTAFNLASVVGEPVYKNPLIMPEFKYRQQYAQADYNPIYEQERVGRQNIAQNQRDTAGMMGNLLQLNSNSVKAKMAASRQAQLDQKGYDADFMGKQQIYADQLAQAKQLREDKNKADEAEKRQYLSDTMTNWEKADQEKAKLYNAELATINQMNTYVNQLSNEYKAVMGKDGQIEIVFKSNNKPVPQSEFDKKVAEDKAKKEKVTVASTKQKGGDIEVKMTNTQPVRKMRNRLY